MRVERKRIFISDLPETVAESEIKDAFQQYGVVESVEIKTRKELSAQHTSLHFGYVNLETDDHTLRTCFKDFANRKWHNRYVLLQLARESFLERLKRERESNIIPNKDESTNIPDTKPITLNPMQNGFMNGTKSSSLHKKRLVESEDDTDSSSNSSLITKSPAKKKEKQGAEGPEEISDSNLEPNIDMVIKNNRGKTLNKNGLKIPSFGNDPVAKIEKKQKKNTENDSEANLKRLQSLKRLKSQYQDKKLLIKAALSNVDSKPKNKIVFEDKEDLPHSDRGKSKQDKSSKSLFNESEDEDFTPDFSVKEQFKGHEGQKLLQLQSKYKHDKRFMLDSRFLDESEELPINAQTTNDDEMTLQDEKKKEYEILNEVLGKTITPKYTKETESAKKSMLRFDPSQPEHAKFEVSKAVEKPTKKKNKELQSKILENKKVEEKEAHTVSKEVFYKVTGDLKESLQEKKDFSLLNLFGKAEERQPDEEYKDTALPLDSNGIRGKNPFHYDSSSDDDDEEIGIQNQEKEDSKKQDNSKTKQTASRNVAKNLSTESFFFKADDYRLQEGADFMEKMKTCDNEDFSNVRRSVKTIVKAKIKNNQRRNRPFKQKLGGNRKKKFIRMKKAMKR